MIKEIFQSVVPKTVVILWILFQWGLAVLVGATVLLTLVALVATGIIPSNWSPIIYVTLGAAARMIDTMLAPLIFRGIDRFVYAYF